jgi:hypothetical protein
MDGILSLSLCLVGGVFYQQAPMKKIEHDHVNGDGVGSPFKGKANDGDGVELGMTPLLQSSLQSRSNRGTNNGR